MSQQPGDPRHGRHRAGPHPRLRHCRGIDVRRQARRTACCILHGVCGRRARRRYHTAPFPAACLGATDADAGADAGPTTCPSSTPIDTSGYPWKSPAVALGSCTQAELDGLVSFQTANPTASYLTLKNSVANPTCQGCIFGLQASATWAPLLTTDGVQVSELDVGGCIAIFTGNDACGRAYQAWFDCGYAACSDCPAGDQQALSACLPKVNTAACKNALGNVTTTCGATAVTNAETACRTGTYVFEGPIKAQCVAGVP